MYMYKVVLKMLEQNKLLLNLLLRIHVFLSVYFFRIFYNFFSNSTAQFYRYFKTIKEREQRIRKGKNEAHKEKCKRSRRLLNVRPS